MNTLKRKKTLILVPAHTARGGITNYYKSIKCDLLDNVEYYLRGARTWPIKKTFLFELYRFATDFFAFIKRLKHNDISIVQTNTSLGFSSLIRDGFFLKFAQRKKILTIAFIHGWDHSKEFKYKRLYKFLFHLFFFQCQRIIVINNSVKKTLLRWGYSGIIINETTLFEKNMTKSINQQFIENKFDELNINKELNFLFLSRVEQKKGIYELIEGFEELTKTINSGYNVSLTICGDGFALSDIKQIIKKSNCNSIKILGFVEGVNKSFIFKESHVFVFPSHTEGMPISVLESMGFGLPVITTPVGGLPEFFKDGENGYYIKINSSKDITRKMLQCVYNMSALKKIAVANYRIAHSKFRSDIVADRINNIHQKLTTG